MYIWIYTRGGCRILLFFLNSGYPCETSGWIKSVYESDIRVLAALSANNRCLRLIDKLRVNVFRNLGEIIPSWRNFPQILENNYLQLIQHYPQSLNICYSWIIRIILQVPESEMDLKFPESESPDSQIFKYAKSIIFNDRNLLSFLTYNTRFILCNFSLP